MKEKIAAALRVIERAAARRCPAVCCSFGKDSLVLLHLCRTVRPDWPVVFHREPYLWRKYRFANQIIEDWNLTVYDWWPQGTAVMEKEGQMEIVNYYPIGGSYVTHLPTGLVEPAPGEPWLCAKDDLYGKPLGQSVPPFDTYLIGQRGDDRDPFYGAMPVQVDARLLPRGPMMVFPLRTWTEGDVWEYTEAHNVPVPMSRYEKVEGKWRERAEKQLNPDYFPACWACLKAGGPKVVECPKYGMKVDNVGDLVRRVTPTPMSYFTPDDGKHGKDGNNERDERMVM